MTELSAESLLVTTLGEACFDSPLELAESEGKELPLYTPDDTRVPYKVPFSSQQPQDTNLSFEKGGARAKLYFEPSKCYAAIVTCGGLCPGLNNVVQSVFFELHYRYGVSKVLGIPYGYQGFDPEQGLEPVELNSEFLETVQNEGGSILGNSRGAVPTEVVVESLECWKIDMLFVIGGDGTLKGAHEIALEVRKRGLNIAVIGIPKTIDNDIRFVYKTFGFDTAVDQATRVLHCAHNEARGAPNGIGLVKVMGRDSGFIACHATLASMVANFTLIPEVRFNLDGPDGFLTLLEDRLRRRGHAVVVVAEGAGLEHVTDGEMAYDASGNIMYSQMSKDVGIFLRDRIKEHFKERGFPASIKYIDPSYIIRSVPASSSDALFCNDLGRGAVHAAMAGKTDMVVGLWHNVLTHVPLEVVTSGKDKVQPNSNLWWAVCEATGQPLKFRKDESEDGT